jgi:hypothetical protein
MPRKMSRRKYAKVVAFLTATMIDLKVSHRVRMTAAQRLAEIHERCELLQERAEVRRERALARMDAGVGPPVADSGTLPDAEATALAFLKGIQVGELKERRNNDDED